MAQQRLGKAIIKIGGNTLESMPGATLDPGGITRQTQIGANAVLGYTETHKQSRVECEVSLRRGVSVRDLERTGVTITFEGDTGQVFSISDAWCMEPPVIDSGKGTARLVYEGPAAEEVA